MHSADQLIAQTLGIQADLITDDLEYQSVREWDSLGHVSLMVAIEKAHGVRIDDELTLALRSVAAIREFLADGPAAAPAPAPGPAAAPAAAAPAAAAVTVHRGLEGVVLDHSAITRIDGTEESWSTAATASTTWPATRASRRSPTCW